MRMRAHLKLALNAERDGGFICTSKSSQLYIAHIYGSYFGEPPDTSQCNISNQAGRAGAAA